MRRHKLAVGLLITALVTLSWLGAYAAPWSGIQAASAASLMRIETATGGVSTLAAPTARPAFDATFRGSHLNTKIWDTCYPKLANYNGGCRNWGNREEAEWYLASQVKVFGGSLHLFARRKRTAGTTSTGAPESYGCRSGMVTSYPGFKFEYGFVQVVANIPHAQGLWPALWLAAADGQYPPEIDMLESWGVDGTTGSFYHPVTGHHSRATYSPDLTLGWQTYSLSWTRTSLTFWVGGQVVLTVTKGVPHQRMYFLADLAEYQPAKRGYCTGQLMIKSVKIWTS
jgi:beta-glucanase (GH16 family)